MSDLTCEYHPHREAVEKCERCNRMICLKDKMVHEKWVGMSENRHTVKMNVCPLCYQDFQIESQTNLKAAKVAMFVILAVILIISIIILTSDQNSRQELYERRSDSGFPQFRPEGEAPEDESPFETYRITIILLVIFSIFSFIMVTNVFPATARKNEEKTMNAQASKEEFLKTIKDPSIQEKYRKTSLTCFQCGSSIGMNDLFCINCGDDTAEEKKASLR